TDGSPIERHVSSMFDPCEAGCRSNLASCVRPDRCADAASVRQTPFDVADACRERVDLAAQLLRLVRTGAQQSQLDPDLADLAGDVVAQPGDLALEPVYPLGERPDLGAQLRHLGAQLRHLTAQLSAQLRHPAAQLCAPLQ